VGAALQQAVEDGLGEIGKLALILDRAYTGMEGAERATEMVLQIRRPGAPVPQPDTRKNRAVPRETSASGVPRPRAPRRRIPVAQRLLGIGAQAG